MPKPFIIKAILLTLGFLIGSLSFLGSYGSADMGAWIRWINYANSYGIQDGYAEAKDFYPPLAGLLLTVSSRLFAAFFGGVFNPNFYFIPAETDIFLSIKFLLCVFLSITSSLFYLWSRNFFLALLLFLFLFLNPVGIGLIDILFAPFLIAGLWAMQKERYILFGFLITMAVMVKWQPIVILPFCLLYAVNKREKAWWHVNFKVAFQVMLGTMITFIPLFSYFGMPIIHSLLHASRDHFLSGNALNFNWLLTWFLRAELPHLFGDLEAWPAGLKIRYIVTDWHVLFMGATIFYSTYIITFLRFAREPKTFETFCTFAGLGYLLFVTFNVGVHENHIFLAVILYGLLAMEDSKKTWLYLALGIVQIMGLRLFMYPKFMFFNQPFSWNMDRFQWGVDVTLWVALFNVLLVIYLYFAAHPNRRRQAGKLDAFPSEALSKSEAQ